MKALVYFDVNRLVGFEGARVRKSIKGALELSNVTHTEALLDSFDIAHFISPDDEIKIYYPIERNKPIIVSALYSENDKNASYLEYKEKLNGQLKVTLKPKALRFLNNANLVLVPTNTCRDMLVNYGVTSEIRTVEPGVNLSRFNFSREDEMEIFNRYYRRNPERKMVVGFGDRIKNINDLACFVKIAKAFPDIDFYFISSAIDERKLRANAMWFGVKCPKNCTTVNLLSDDVYRSALLNASMVIFPGYNIVGAVSIADAMASKSQILTRKNVLIDGIEANKELLYVAETDAEMIDIVRKYFSNEIQPTIDTAYEFISKHTLDKYGEQLIEIYNEQISLKNK